MRARRLQGIGPLPAFGKYMARNPQARSFMAGGVGQRLIVHGVGIPHQDQRGRQARQALGCAGHRIRVLCIARTA
ncbi:hypothetical protein D3C71_2165350 [compost metagenome]